MKKTESSEQLLKRFQKRVPELQERLREIREEFKEWLDPDLEDHDNFSMEYIGDGSEYD